MKQPISKAICGLFLLGVLLSSCEGIMNSVKINQENDKGLQLYLTGESEESIVHFKNALSYNPRDKETRATINRNIALAFNAMLETDSSLAYHKKAAECYNRGEYGYLLNMADANLQQDQTEAALTKLLKANALQPDDLGIHNSLGLIYLGEYDYDFFDGEKALKHNLKTYELGKDIISEQVLAQTYMVLDDFENAKKHLTTVYIQYPEIAQDILDWVEGKIMLEEKLDLEKSFQLILELDPEKEEAISQVREDWGV
ncbi:hypothetical protein N9811_07820 [Bacteroidia bacterium]|nr:hypothetical protein [Bacteroidia bacterium]